MLLKENYTIEHIRELHEVYKKDPSLLERVVFAFGLLEALAKSGLPFIFKGGSSLMLMMDNPLRLSTDIDIMVSPGIDINKYIMKTSKIFPFKRHEEQIRKGNNQIEKRHFKFIYDSILRGTEFYILLDVVFSETPYAKTMTTGIYNSLLLTDTEPVLVTIPTPDCILGDKLTAFAPHTTGIPLGVDKELEVIKQLFDIATLKELIKDQKVLQQTYEKVAFAELSYRGLTIETRDVIIDTIKASICIIGKGLIGDEYHLYLKGIHALDSHIMNHRYNGEIAAYQACQVLYLATCLLTGESIKKIENPGVYISESIEKTRAIKNCHI